MINVTVWLSQIQFFSSLSFMGLFFAIELGLAWVLLLFKLGIGPGRSPAWREAYRLWARVFAIASILALASSMPVLIQLGSIWPGLAEKTGNVSGPLLAATVLSAYVFKSLFSGLMLFGERKLAPWLHTLAVFMVALGATLAAFWITVLQSWMQAPSGAELVDGQYRVSSWADVVFNPLLPSMLAWLCSVAALTTALILVGVSVRQSRRHPVVQGERLAFTTGLWLAFLASLALMASMAGYSCTVAPYQPAKAAATAAHWNSSEPSQVVLFAWPEAGGQRNRAEWALAWSGAEAWLAHDADGRRVGLDRVAGMHPPVALTFWSFRFTLLAGCVVALSSLFLLFWRRFGNRSGKLVPKGWQGVLSTLAYSGWLLVLSSLAYVWVGNAPYVVGSQLTLVQVAGQPGVGALLMGIVLTLVIGLVLLTGFVRLVHYFALYGVVPVTRYRGKA